MQAIIQILKVNDLRTGTKDGRTWEMQDAECALLTEDGAFDQVGVLMIPKALRGQVKPGIYTGGYAMQPDRDRRISPVLVSLIPVPTATQKPAAPKA